MSDPNANAYYGADFGITSGFGEIFTANFMSNEDRASIFNLTRQTGIGAYAEYMDRTYINDYGIETPVWKLFVDFEKELIDGEELESKLLGKVDENNNQITGADWFKEFEETALAQYRAGQGLSGGGAGGPTTQQQIDSVFASISDRALQMGLSYTEDELVEVATIAVNSNWTDTQVVDKLLTNYKYGEITDGTISDLADQTIAAYNQFLLPIDRNSAMQMAKRIAMGEQTVDGVVSSIKRLAKAQYGWASDFIDDGMTLVEAMAPQRSAMATELELDAQDIDLNNTTFFDAMFTTDDKGAQRLRTSSEIRSAARELPQWENTENARTKMSQLTASLGKIFGRSAF